MPGDPAKPARVVQVVMREVDGRMLFVPDRVEIRGRRRQIRSSGIRAGTFDFSCLIPGHREAGMTGAIVVR